MRKLKIYESDDNLNQELTQKDVTRYTGFNKADYKDDEDFSEDTPIKDYIMNHAEMLAYDDSRELRKMYKKMLKKHPILAEEIANTYSSSVDFERDY